MIYVNMASSSHCWIQQFLQHHREEHSEVWSIAVALSLIIVPILYFCSKQRVVLLDFTVFDPPEEAKITNDEIMKYAKDAQIFTEENLNFMQKILNSSGISNRTAIPQDVLKLIKSTTGMKPEDIANIKVPFASRLQEAKIVLRTVVADLLEKTGIKPEEVGVVIVACDAFAPTPSLAAILVNMFKFPQSVLTYSLAGMGCANGGICVDLAKHILKSNPNTVCLLVSHENCSSGTYIGNEKSMLLPLCLFRYSGAACILSNRRKDMRRAKYDLLASVRIHVAQEDEWHTCIEEMEDQHGVLGVKLSKSIIPAATAAISANLRVLAPKVLPVSELVRCVLNQRYQPDFQKAFQHFCLQGGGKGVIDALQKALRLSDYSAQPSRDALYKFGNTAGASSWYTLSAIEAKRGVKRGEKVGALLLGGGFKSVSLAWRARRDINELHSNWA